MKMGFEHRRRKEMEIENIQKLIKNKEMKLIRNPGSKEIRSEINMFQNKLQNILQEEVQKNVKFFKKIFCRS